MVKRVFGEVIIIIIKKQSEMWREVCNLLVCYLH